MSTLFWTNIAKPKQNAAAAAAAAAVTSTSAPASPSPATPTGGGEFAAAPLTSGVLAGLEPLEEYKLWCYGPDGPGRDCIHRDLVLGTGGESVAWSRSIQTRMHEEYLSESAYGRGGGEHSPESGEVARLTSGMVRKGQDEDEEEEDVDDDDFATRSRALAAERALIRAEQEQGLAKIRAEARLSVDAVREAGEHARAALYSLTSHTAGEAMAAIGQLQKQVMEQLQLQLQQMRTEQYHHHHQQQYQAAPKAWLQDRAEFPPLLAQDLPIQAKGQAEYVPDLSEVVFQQQQQQQQQLTPSNSQAQLGYPLHHLPLSGFQQQQQLPLLQQHNAALATPAPAQHLFYHQESQQVQHQMDLLSHIPSRS